MLEENIPSSIRDLKKSAKSGDLHALAQLGVNYLIGHQVSRDVNRGFKDIRKAAQKGEIASQTLLATLYAAGMGTAENWGKAYDWLIIAAQNGDPRAINQVVYFVPDLQDPSTKRTWQDVRNLLDCIDDENKSDATTHHTEPKIQTQENFLDSKTCAYVMKASRPYLKQAYVNDAASGAIFDSSRTNSAMSFFPLENDLVIQKVNKKIATFLKHPTANGEPLSVLHYKSGQTYRDHYDFFNPEFPAHTPHLKAGGQRVKTLLVYLNDEYTGGETNFPKLDWKYRGQPGTAVTFENVNSKGELLVNSLHSGLPPETGEKWIISKWLKDQPQY